jgi:hypothetical protein
MLACVGKRSDAFLPKTSIAAAHTQTTGALRCVLTISKIDSTVQAGASIGGWVEQHGHFHYNLN